MIDWQLAVFLHAGDIGIDGAAGRRVSVPRRPPNFFERVARMPFHDPMVDRHSHPRKSKNAIDIIAGRWPVGF
jgi:hypothetical protein